ncbi:MAG: MFS transporter [Bacillota bacterium]|jgi:MFS family permease
MNDSRRAWLFFAVSTLFSMAASSVHPVTPTIIQQRGFGDYMFGVALAAMMTANFLFSPFWGQLVNYISSRRVILIGCLGYAIGQAGFGLAGSEGMMVAARMFAGIFTGGIFTATLTYVVNTAPPEKRSNFLTVSATIQTVASAFGYFVGGMLGEIGVNVAVVMQVSVLVVSGVLFYLVCCDDAVTEVREIKVGQLFRKANPVSAFLAGSRIMTPLLVSIFAVAALANLGNSGFDQSFNYYLKAQLGLSSGYNGAIKALIGIVSLVANSSIAMWLIKKTDIRRSIIHVYLLCSIAMLGVVLLNATVPFVAANVIYFGFFAVSVPLTQSLAADRARGADSNLTMGFYNGLKSLGGIFGALAAGLLYTVNPKWPFVLGLAAFLTATVVVWYHYSLSKQEDVRTAKGKSVTA